MATTELWEFRFTYGYEFINSTYLIRNLKKNNNKKKTVIDLFFEIDGGGVKNFQFKIGGGTEWKYRETLQIRIKIPGTESWLWIEKP